jgi:hypothetical protein
LPTIVNSYNTENPLGKLIAQLGETAFGPGQMKGALARGQLQGIQQKNTNLPLYADAISTGDIASAMRHGALAGVSGTDLAGYGRVGGISRAPSIDDLSVTRSMLLNAPMSATPMGQQRALASTERIAGSKPTAFIPGPGQAPQYGTASSVVGRQAPETFAEARGRSLNTQTPFLTPAQQREVIGANLDYSKPFNIASPGGPPQISRVSPETGAVEPAPGTTPGQYVANAQGAAQDVGVSGDKTVVRQLIESRTNVRNAVQMIDQTKVALAQPDAGAQIGPLGGAASLFNGLRAQYDAVAREFGAPTFMDESSDAGVMAEAKRAAMSLAPRASELGIGADVITSRLMDLAYVIAKAKDPQGRITQHDIADAHRIVGGSMDPNSRVAVLDDLKNRLVSLHNIREEETRRMYPNLPAGEAMAPGAQPPPAEQSAAPAPGARQASDGNWYVPDPQRPGKYLRVDQ